MPTMELSTPWSPMLIRERGLPRLAAGESQLCSQLAYDTLPTISVTAYGVVSYNYRRRMFVVDGVTASGQPFGHVNVQSAPDPPP